MSAIYRHQDRTRMFARVLGPFFTIVAVVVAARAADMRQLLSEFTASDVWPWGNGGLHFDWWHRHRCVSSVLAACRDRRLGTRMVARGTWHFPSRLPGCLCVLGPIG